MNRLNKILVTGLFTAVCFSGCKAVSQPEQAWNNITSQKYKWLQAHKTCYNLLWYLKKQIPFISKIGIRSNLHMFCNHVANHNEPDTLARVAINLGVYRIDPSSATSDNAKEIRLSGKSRVDKFVEKTIFDKFVKCTEPEPHIPYDPERFKKCFEAFSTISERLFGKNFSAEMKRLFGKNFSAEMKRLSKKLENKL